MAALKSKIWKFFTKTDKANFVKCILCAKKLKYSNNTTNMIQHIKLKHKKMVLNLWYSNFNFFFGL